MSNAHTFEDPAQSPNERRWHVEQLNGDLRVTAWTDDGAACDRVLLERTGMMIKVKLPPAPDLRVAARAYPALERFLPLVHAQRRLLEAGHRETLPPILVHTAVARELWTVFDMKEPCPTSGAAAPFGLLVVWAPELDQFVPAPAPSA